MCAAWGAACAAAAGVAATAAATAAGVRPDAWQQSAEPGLYLGGPPAHTTRQLEALNATWLLVVQGLVDAARVAHV
jgi:hypothetical protein